MPLGALIIVIDTLARSRVGKWRTARLDDRRDGDHDTCGDDTGDSWARGRDVTSTPTTMLANLWRCRGRLLGARRGAEAQFPFLDFIYTSTHPDVGPGVGEAMRRREFITFVAGAASWPLAALAQQSERTRHIGILMAFSESDLEAQSWAAGFREELGKLGWTEGRNIQIDTRWARADVELLQRFAKQLVALQPDLILTGSTPATAAMRQQTNTTPIVFAMVGDPVGSGFVASLSRPGGNLTGFVPIENSLGGKWVELLKEVAPRVVRVALVFDPAMEPFTSYYLDPFKAAAASLGMEATVAPVYDMIELERVVATSAREPNSGLIVMPDAFTIGHHEDITSSIARYRVPTVYPFRIFAEVGGLVSYGSSALDEFRRAASYADRILKGANVCLAFAGMQAVEAGYNVRGVVEASGGLDVTTRELATARIKDHGITPVNWNHACGPYSQSRPHTARLLGESYE